MNILRELNVYIYKEQKLIKFLKERSLVYLEAIIWFLNEMTNSVSPNLPFTSSCSRTIAILEAWIQ